MQLDSTLAYFIVCLVPPFALLLACHLSDVVIPKPIWDLVTGAWIGASMYITTCRDEPAFCIAWAAGWAGASLIFNWWIHRRERRRKPPLPSRPH